MLQKKCLSIRQTSLGDNDVTVADSLCWIGNIHREKRELDEARECFLKALSVKVAVLGKDHSECSEILQNLGEYNALLHRLSCVRITDEMYSPGIICHDLERYSER